MQKPDLEVYPSTQNGWWLAQALEVLPRPLVILSLNDTILGVQSSPELGILQVGTDVAGLGFGQFRGSYAYHTILDNPERLDPRSLQHQGQNALSLSRHFGVLSLDGANQQHSAPLVAFNILPGQVISYPSTWALPLAVAVALLLVVVLVFGIWRGGLKLSSFLLGFLLFVVSLVGTVAVVFILLALMLGALPAHLLYFLGNRRPWIVPSAFGVLAIVFLVVELVSSRFDADQPRPDYVQYRLDADTGEATWISDTNPPTPGQSSSSKRATRRGRWLSLPSTTTARSSRSSGPSPRK